MSITYRAIGGESFKDISLRMFGTASKSSEIRSANPSVTEPIIPGTVLNIPKEIKNTLRNQSGVSLNINGKSFSNFTSLNITRVLDGIDTISFECPFVKGQFQQAQFDPMSIYIDGELIFSGTIIDVLPSYGENGTTLTINAYAKCGILQDCSVSPRDYLNKSLDYIAKDLCKGFGIEVRGDTGDSFKQVEYSGGTIWEFLIDLAKQKNKLLASTTDGNLIFFKEENTSLISAKFRVGFPPMTGVSPSYNTRGLYSEITGRVPSNKTTSGKTSSIKTGLTVFRPYFTEFSDIKKSEITSALESMKGRMFASAESYSIDVATWTNAQGELWTPGMFVTLQGDEIFLENEEKFTIRNVVLSQQGGKTAQLNLVKEGSFDE